MKGQNSRSGRGTRPGFEGGQTPLYRKLPKFVGKPFGPGHRYIEYNLLKVNDLEGFGIDAQQDWGLIRESSSGGAGRMVANYDTLHALGRVTKGKRKVPCKFVLGKAWDEVKWSSQRPFIEARREAARRSDRDEDDVELEARLTAQPPPKRLDGVLNFMDGLIVQAHGFTKTAREAIESRGGVCEVLKRSNGAVLAKADEKKTQRWMRDRSKPTKKQVMVAYWKAKNGEEKDREFEGEGEMLDRLEGEEVDGKGGDDVEEDEEEGAIGLDV
jgi:ribosomal protein L15